MKLFDMSTEESANVIITISALSDNIFTDKVFMESISKAVDRSGLTRAGLAMEGLKRIFSSAQTLLGPHRDDVFGIIGALNGKSVAEISAQPFRETKDEIKEIFEDKDLMDFFSLFSQREKNA